MSGRSHFVPGEHASNRIADPSATRPSVAIIVPLMDRAADLRVSLPRMLCQDYANYTVYLVDNSSIDDLDRVVLECTATDSNPFDAGQPEVATQARRIAPLMVIRRPRPEFFSFAVSRNCGVRYSSSDLLLFVNGDSWFDGPDTLRANVDAFLYSRDISPDWFAAWRTHCGYPPLTIPPPPSIESRFRRLSVHTAGSLLLLDREVFQQLGGYNELLQDWGYEDTDLGLRLELAGFGRSEMRGVSHPQHDDDEALRVRHFRVMDHRLTWMRNRLISDLVIGRSGVVSRATRVPGEDSGGVQIVGAHTAHHAMRQFAWVIEPELPQALREAVDRVAAEDPSAHVSTPASPAAAPPSHPGTAISRTATPAGSMSMSIVARRASLSLCTVTNSPPAVVAAFIRAWRPHVDEIVLAVDERADPRTPDACRALVNQLHVVPATRNMERYLGWLFSRATGDWILRIDDDELPSAVLTAMLPELVNARAHSHIFLPCRWIYPTADRFIADDRWQRNSLHPRLVRNVSGLWRFSGRVRSDVQVVGSSRIVEAPFLHVTALLDDIETRRERAMAYAAIDPSLQLAAGRAVIARHLPEEQRVSDTEPLGLADAACVRTFLRDALAPVSQTAGPPLRAEVQTRDLDAWLDERQLADDGYAARVRIVHPLEPIRAGETQQVHVEVVNDGGDHWPPGAQAWPLIRLGHHWRTLDGVALEAATPRACFSERVLPGATTRVMMPVIAPTTPGRYILALDVVDEFVRWFGCEMQQEVAVLPPPTMPEPRPARQTGVGGWLRRPFAGLRRGREARRGRRDILADDLRLLHDTLSPTGFGDRYWVWGGLLLGWAREGRLMEHDLFDVDFAFAADDLPLFVNAAGALVQAGFAPLLRFVNNAGRPTEYSFCRNRAKFEFFILEPRGASLRYYTYCHAGLTGSVDVQNTAEIAAQATDHFRFLRRTWRKHHDHERELADLYGDWRTPNPDWSYSAERTIIGREPWRATGTSWLGDFATEMDTVACRR